MFLYTALYQAASVTRALPSSLRTSLRSSHVSALAPRSRVSGDGSRDAARPAAARGPPPCAPSEASEPCLCASSVVRVLVTERN